MPKGERDDLAELAALAVVPRRVEVYTLDEKTDAEIPRTVRVAPMTLNVCGEVAVAIKPIVKTIGVKIRLDDLPLIVADHYESVRALVAAATKEDEAFVGELPLDQFLLLARAVFEVNHDFFDRQVGPIGKALAATMFVADGDGPTPSTSSPSTATATP